MSAISGDQHDARSLSQLIQRDQAITGHVLRIANTPAYCTRGQVSSLRQAIVQLGMRAVGEIVFLISCKARMFKVDGFEKELKHLFEHAFATALFAQEIARVRRMNVEESFVAGLLHDVGRAVLLQEIADCLIRYPQLAHEDARPVLKARHAELSSKMTEAWALPPRIAEAIRFHHQPDHAPNYTANAYLVQLADAFAHSVEADKQLDPADEALAKHPAVVPLHLYPDDVARLLEGRAKIREAVGALA